MDSSRRLTTTPHLAFAPASLPNTTLPAVSLQEAANGIMSVKPLTLEQPSKPTKTAALLVEASTSASTVTVNLVATQITLVNTTAPSTSSCLIVQERQIILMSINFIANIYKRFSVVLCYGVMNESARLRLVDLIGFQLFGAKVFSYAEKTERSGG